MAASFKEFFPQRSDYLLWEMYLDPFPDHLTLHILIQNLGVNTVKFLSEASAAVSNRSPVFPEWSGSHVGLRPIKCSSMPYRTQILLINGRQLIFTDNGSQRPCITYLGIARKTAGLPHLVICPCIAFTDTILHQSGRDGSTTDRRVK